jgi:hypothetical protein
MRDGHNLKSATVGVIGWNPATSKSDYDRLEILREYCFFIFSVFEWVVEKILFFSFFSSVWLVIGENNFVTYSPTSAEFQNFGNLVSDAFERHSHHYKGILVIPTSQQQDTWDQLYGCLKPQIVPNKQVITQINEYVYNCYIEPLKELPLEDFMSKCGMSPLLKNWLGNF